MQCRSNKFKSLLCSAVDLRLALESNPRLITEQDEDGMTLLHHAAQIGYSMGSYIARQILNVLFNTPGLDFSIKDNKSNTPVHTAALAGRERVTCQYVFPAFIREAARRGFDFSTLGHKGQSVLHIAARTLYIDPRGFLGRQNNVKNVLDNAPDPGLDVLSRAGSTALFYAVNHCHIYEANALLDAGANPLLFESKDSDPFAMIDERLKKFTEALSQDEYADRHKNIRNLIDLLNKLKQKMLAFTSEKERQWSYAEIRKSARILAQGFRTDSLFANLPDEILIKIAGHTKNPKAHTQAEAEKIAEVHLSKPQK